MTETGAAHDTKGESHLGFALPPPASLGGARAAGLACLALAVVGGVLVFRYLPEKREQAALTSAVQQAAHLGRQVEVVAPSVLVADRPLALPGTVQPREETVLYARATGYVHKWTADIGDHVKAGALLAELETPELDQELGQNEAQLSQLRASVAQAKANLDLAESNLARARQLAPAVVSQAELDTTKAQSEVGRANLRVAEANVEAQEANIRRLRQLKQFAHVTAPFEGTITQRSVERGMLVTASNAQPIYKLAATDTVRVFIQVPQGVAPAVRVGAPAKVSVREYPGAPFEGKVARSALELSEATRTMTTEITVPNADGKLIPGMYAEVSMDIRSAHRLFQLPATALLSDAKGQRVVIVDDQQRMHFVPVVVERDNGSTVELSSGLTGSERVIKLPSAAFVENEPVVVAAPPDAGAR